MRDPWSEEIEAIRRLAESARDYCPPRTERPDNNLEVLSEILAQITELCEGSECAVWQTTEGTTDAH